MILAFVLGCALIAQGTPIENKDALEKMEVDLSTSVERGNRVRRGFDYEWYMRRALNTGNQNIQVVQTLSLFGTNQILTQINLELARNGSMDTDTWFISGS